MSVKIMGMVWDSNLPSYEKMVLLAYADHADHDGKNIYPSIGRIAWKTGYKDRRVQQITRTLEKNGILIEDGEGPGGTNKWKIAVDKLPQRPDYNNLDKTLTGGGANFAPGGASHCTGGVHPIAPEPSLNHHLTVERSLKSFNLPPEIAESVQEASNLLAEEKEEVSMSFGIPVEELSTPPYLPPEIPAPPTPGIPEPPAHETDIEYMRRMTKERLAKHGIGAPLPPPSHEAEENRKRGMEAIAKWQEQRRLDLIALENGGIPVQDIQDIPVIEDYLAKVEEDIRPLARVFCYSHRRPPRDKGEDSYWRKEWWGQRTMGITPEDTTKAIYRMRKGDGKGGNILSIKSPASITAFADEERIKRAE